MAYVGNSPEKGNFRKADQITCSATATYNLLVGGVAVNPNQNQVICSLNGVVQSSGDSYTIANSQITFASALTSSDVIDFILILGDTLDVGVPSDDTVDASKITANIITGQTALGSTPADTDELLISDAGTLKRVDYSHLKSSVVNRPNAKSLIINGSMDVAQRGVSTASITGGGFYTADRFGTNNSGAFIGTWTQTQESLSSGDAFTDGFAKSLKMDNTTANGSPAANSQCRIDYNFEGQDLQLLKHGTASAEKTTLSFWIKATKTGTNIVKMYKPDADRSCSIAYTVSTTNTWEKKVLNFPADTTGTVIANDNTTGIQMSFGIAMGSSYTSGTLATTWAADSSANAFVGQVNNADSTSNNWEITGVQLEVGEYTSSTLPPFQHESYGDNLKRCMRYYFTDALYSSGGNTGLVEAYIGTSDANYKHIFKQFPVAMRAAPTISNIDFRQDVAASSTALTSIDSAFATTLTADLYGRNNDHAAPGYYHGADYSAEL
jgi:hypothetical protein